jgi:O-antigen ligase
MYLLLLMIMIMPFEMSPYLYISRSFLGVIPDFTVIKLLGMVGFLWAMLKVVTRESGPPIFDSIQAKLFASLFIGIMISAVLNESRVEGVSKYLVFMIFMPFVLVCLRDAESIRPVVYAMATTFVIVLPYAARQTGRYLGGRMGVGLTEPNYFAATLVLLTPLPFAIASYQKTRLARALWMGAGCALAGSIFLTASRGGFLGLMVAALVYAYRRVGFRGAAGVVALLLLAVLPTDLGERALATFGNSAEGGPSGIEHSNRAHVALFWAGIRMMADAPVFGVGPNRFKDYSMAYTGLPIPYIAHNTYLELAAETGLPVLFLYLLLYGTVLVALHRASKLQGGPEVREMAAWAEGLFTGLIGFSVCAGFISAQYEKFFWMSMFTSIAITRIAARRAAATEHATEPTPVLSPARS